MIAAQVLQATGLPNLTPGFETWFQPSGLPDFTGIWSTPPATRRAPRKAPSQRSLPTLRSKEKGEPAVSLLRLIDTNLSRRSLPTRPGEQPAKGIDLTVRGVEVRKLFYAAFARGLVKDGYDPEEALQEVYRGLLARNLGKCPFDASKSSFGHYVHIVTRCVLANYIRKEKRRLAHESGESQLGSPGESNSFSIQEAPDRRTGTMIEPGSIEELSVSIASATGSDVIQVRGALQLLADGHPRRKVCALLQVQPSWLDEVLRGARAYLVG
jgi:hypothetical protein